MPTLNGSTLLEVMEFPRSLPPDYPLGDREVGAHERALIEQKLENVKPGETLGVDTRRVKFINYTFSDECFGKLASNLRAGDLGDRFVVLVATRKQADDTLKDVSLALVGRKLAMLCVADPEDPSDPYVIGELPEYLRDTLEAVKPGDTNELLANRLGINLTTCSNRTDKLVGLRLLRRKPHAGKFGYKQYEFTPILSPA